MEKQQLLSLLARGRKEGNTYLIARAAIMLQGRGFTCHLSSNEKRQILECLEKARNRKGVLQLEPGYELARWLMLSCFIFASTSPPILASDLALIDEAITQYCLQRNIKQLASLVHTLSLLRIKPSLNILPPKKRKQVWKRAAALS